jgi:putative hydrolase of the HAD superfamily
MKIAPDQDVIFFDAGRTLLYPHPSIGELYSRTAARQGRFVDASVMQAALSETLMRRRDDEPGDMAFWRRTVHATMERVGGVPDSEACFQELWRVFGEPGSWRLYDDAVETLTELRRRGHRLGLLSNWDRRLRQIIGTSELCDHFEALIISDEVGAEKPSSAIFQTALDTLGVSPDRAVHIGDSFRDDYSGAQAMGIRPVLIDRDDDASVTNDVVRIRSLRELL